MLKELSNDILTPNNGIGILQESDFVKPKIYLSAENMLPTVNPIKAFSSMTKKPEPRTLNISDNNVYLLSPWYYIFSTFIGVTRFLFSHIMMENAKDTVSHLANEAIYQIEAG